MMSATSEIGLFKKTVVTALAFLSFSHTTCSELIKLPAVRSPVERLTVMVENQGPWSKSLQETKA